MSLGKRAAQGAFWNYAAFLIGKGVLAVATLILARVLSPAEYGLVGMALLVITGLDILREFGIGAALIYRQRDSAAAAEVAFLLSVALGVGLFAANWLAAPLLVSFFKIDRAQDVATLIALLRVLGFSILFTSVGSTQDAQLQKALDYRRRMVPEVGRAVIKGALQVGLALTGFGVWSLVIGQVVGDGCATLLLWLASPWRPTFRIERALIRPILGYGVQIMTVDALGTLLSDVDYAIIGATLGTVPLGAYTLAFRIPELLIKNLSQAVSNVAFPVAARLQSDTAAMRSAYLTMQRYMLVILAPLGCGLYAVTPALLHILFQTKWEAAIPVMQILAIYMLLGGISHWPGVIYKAVGRPDILNGLSLVKLVLLVPVLWWAAVNVGIVGVAWGQLAVRVVGILIDMAFVSRFVQVSVWTNLRALWPPLAAGAGMALALQALYRLDPGYTSISVLALAVVAAGVIYLALIWLFDRSAVSGLLGLLQNMLGRNRPPAVRPDVELPV